MYFYLFFLIIFNFSIINSMELLLYPNEGPVKFLPKELHEKIRFYGPVSSYGAMKSTCQLLNKYYQFDDYKKTIKNEDYTSCSKLILKLANSGDKNKQIQALEFLKSNNYKKRKKVLKELYGDNIIKLIPGITLTDHNLNTFFTQLKSLEYTGIINPTIDSFALELICYANNKEIINLYYNCLIHYLVSSPDHLDQIKILARTSSAKTKQELFSFKNPCCYTPIHVACTKKNNGAVIKLLLETGCIDECTLTITNRNGYNGLQLACEGGYEDNVRALINSDKIKKDIFNIINHVDGYNLLSYACANGNRKIVDLVIKSGKLKTSTIKKRNLSGDTALHIACQRGKNIKKLIELDEITTKTVNRKNFSGNRPLHITCLTNDIKGTKKLIDSNKIESKSFNKTNMAGETVYHIACDQQNEAIIAMLIKAGKTKRKTFLIRNISGHTAIDIARKHGNNTIVELLTAAMSH